jgi:hypothetical protein
MGQYEWRYVLGMSSANFKLSPVTFIEKQMLHTIEWDIGLSLPIWDYFSFVGLFSTSFASRLQIGKGVVRKDVSLPYKFKNKSYGCDTFSCP